MLNVNVPEHFKRIRTGFCYVTDGRGAVRQTVTLRYNGGGWVKILSKSALLNG